MSSIKELLAFGRSELLDSSPSAYLDAELILSHLLGLTKVELISNSGKIVAEEQKEIYLQMIMQRKNYMPVAYLTGKREFYGLNFEVGPSALIPRPETELLVELALAEAEKMKSPIKILDLGTGSGCISIALACNLKKMDVDFQLTALDRCREALQLATQNVKSHNLENEISLLQSDWYGGLEEGKVFDLIISNPPYIALGDTNVSKETKYEPESALYAGSTGLVDIIKILDSALKRLSAHGILLCEIGSNQRLEIQQYADSIGLGELIEFKTDLAGLDRVFLLRKEKLQG